MQSNNVTVDEEAFGLLEIVCAAGGARPAFNGDLNEALDLLARAGFLAIENSPSAIAGSNLRAEFYRPTQRGISVLRTVSVKVLV